MFTVLPLAIRVDKGTETGDLTTMQSYLRHLQGDLEDATDSVMYGPSTQNKIERWWRELLDRMETYFKEQLARLLNDGDYDSSDDVDRNLLAFVYIPVLQKELDIFRVSIWNNHRGRQQKNRELPAGVPEHIYNFPEHYGGQKCGFPVTEERLREVAELSNVLESTGDFLDENFRQECQRHIPNTADIKPAEAANAYLFLKANFDINRI